MYNIQKIWLTLCAFMVLLMIFVGGWTRLTDSGLSIVEWKPVTGIIPPLNEQSWEKEFADYKTSPEYKKINLNFSLEDFKKIFWLEFIHRILGRITGLIIILPAIFFGLKRQLRRPIPYISMSLLVIFQGIMGWYMVKSGLIDNPHVSQYRLAAHLITAVFLYSVILWEIFRLRTLHSTSSSSSGLPPASIPSSNIIWAIITLFLIYIQIFLGGIVAGLDAGLIYNEFPLMGENFLPPEFRFGSQILNDPISSQFLHRLMAYIVSFSIFILGLKLLNTNPNLTSMLIISLMLQVGLGILTLVYVVPIKLALAHQLFAVLLLSIVLYAIFEIKEAQNER